MPARECKILSPGQTRWLSLENCVNRLLEQLPALKLYFLAEYAEDKTKTCNTILEALNNPLTKPFLYFVSYALGQFNKFNKAFQSEKPMLHELQDRVTALVLTFAQNFLNTEYIRSQDIFKLDPFKSSENLPMENIYLGEMISATYYYFTSTLFL